MRQAAVALVLVTASLLAGCTTCRPYQGLPSAYADYPRPVAEPDLRAALEADGWTLLDPNETSHLAERVLPDGTELRATRLGGRSDAPPLSLYVLSMGNTADAGPGGVTNSSAEARAYLEPHVAPLLDRLAQLGGEPTVRYEGGGEHCGAV